MSKASPYTTPNTHSENTAKSIEMMEIQGEAITQDKNDEEKEEYYKHMEKVFNEIPRYCVKTVIRDFNDQIRKEVRYRPVNGEHSQHQESSGNGRKLAAFTTVKNLRIVTTYFQHREIHKGGRVVNQIDHMDIESKRMKYILDTQSYRGAYIGTDHILVRAKIKYKRPPKEENRRQTRIRYSMEKLKDEQIKREFLRNLNEKDERM
ncbi:hypothetical protein ILUMI_21525 [Ignelater luminosus]|uniref:Uncharacterized protein n=1 Tax=Ignelater luminosus TaxID=2038154 RepID=A0A8K0G3S4_IGNLU|nr:hypothetical protein ILUMI_21525 [Ignelater luminosus]